MAWQADNQDGSGFGIYGQRYDANGLAQEQASLPSDFTEDRTLYADASLITDPDGVGAINWQWQRSVDNGLTWTNIANSIAANYTLGDADVGNLVRVAGAYTDGLGTVETVYSQPSSAVINVNDAPLITSNGGGDTATVSISENTTAVTPVTATDPDASTTLSYSISGGVDGAFFDINSATGALSFKTPPDFEAPADAGVNNVYDVVVQASDGTAFSEQIVRVSITDRNEIVGTEGADVLTAGPDSTDLLGLDGNDTLVGGTGNDTLNGGAGSDILTGGAGRDTFIVDAGSDSITDFGNGNDVLTVAAAAAASLTLGADWTAVAADIENNGSIGINANGYNVDLSAITTGSGFSLSNNNSVAVTLAGSARNDGISGGSGNDIINGGAGDDYISGGRGSDTLTGGEGADTFYTDHYFFLNGGSDVDTVADLGLGADVLQANGTSASDNTFQYPRPVFNATVVADWTATSATYNYYSAINLTSNGFAVDLSAVTSGNRGFTVTNIGAATQFIGSRFDDTLVGGTGNDTLNGGAGSDILTGGAGRDIATYDGAITDYTLITNGDGSTTVVDNRGSSGNGTDTLRGIEIVSFGGTLYTTDGVPANLPPAITSNGGGATAEVGVGENTTAVATVTATDPDANTTLSYSISGGADAGLFDINAATGALSFISAPNFEVPTDTGANNVYDVVVKVSDGTLTDTQAIAVIVANVNEAPVFSKLTISGNLILDPQFQKPLGTGAWFDWTTPSSINDGGGNILGNYASIKLGGDLVQWFSPLQPGDYSLSFFANNPNEWDAVFGPLIGPSIVGYSGAIWAPFLQIAANSGWLNYNHDFNLTASNSNIIEVSFTNGYTVPNPMGTIINISNVSLYKVQNIGSNEATVFVNVAEDTTAVTNITATDPDANTTLSYSISGGTDAVLFDINTATGELVFKAAPNFEAPADMGGDNVYDVVVQVSDGTLTDTQAIAVTVTNVNEAPIITNSVEVVKVGAEFLVNTQTTNLQQEPMITGLINGGFVVTWSDFSRTLGDSSGTSIKAQVFGADGIKVGDEFLVNTETTNSQLSPTIASLASGGFVISWMDQVGSLGSVSYSIKAQAFSSDGTKVGTEFLINAETAGSQRDPAITGLASGGFVISWWDLSDTLGDGSSSSVKAQVFGADGTKVGAGFLINTETANNQLLPTITSLTNGSFVASWTDRSGTLGDSSGSSIKAQMFGGDGTKIGAEFLVNTETANNQYSPTITSLTNGGFVVSWEDYGGTFADGSDTNIKAQVFGADGTKVGSEFLVNTETANSQYSPMITSLSNGGFVVSWVDYSGSLNKIKAQAFSADGAKVGTEFLVNPPTTSQQALSTITGLTNGSFVVSWQDQSDANIKAQLFALNEGGATLAFSTAENTTAVTTVTATDPDANTTLSYSISGGADAGLFDINAATGALSFKTAPNFEAAADVGGNNVYDVEVQVSDGSLTDTQAIAVTVTNVNEAPIVSTPIADQSVNEDTAWSYQVPAGTFSDVDGDTLTYTAKQANGADLPSWLSFNAATRAFSGTPPQDFNGNISLTVTASDGSTSVSDTFVLTVNPVEDEATGSVVVNGTVAEGGTVGVDVNVTDVDGAISGTAYQWQISTNGTDGWSDLSGATFSSYAIASDQSQVGKYLRVVATTTDALGGTTAFTSAATVAIANVEDEATGSVAVTGTVAEGGTVGVDLNVTDVDGAITATAYQWQISTNGTDGWTDLTGATSSSYAIASDQSQVGKYLRVVATTTDALGGTTAFTSAATAAIANVNDAPTVAALIADQSATEDAAFSFVVPAGSFADVDPGDVLTLSATLANDSPLPSWLIFDAATGAFSGTPLRGDVGAVSVRVTAKDVGGLTVSDDFNLTVAPETIVPTATITDNVPGTATGTVLYTVTFSETVTGLAANDFAVTNGTVSSVTGSGTSYVVAIAPSVDFEGTLALSLNAGAVLDKAGNQNAGVAAAGQVVDTRKPVVTTITPAADSTGVAVATNITLAYSEAIRAGTGVIELRNAAGALVESFNVATSNRLTFAGSSLTVDPTALLSGATQYRLSVADGAVLDVAGNAAVALTTYTFTTLSAVNIINGTAVANTLNGTAGDDAIYGFGGNDTLNGNAGNDLLDGGTGNDRMTGGAGDDIYVVDSAADTVTEAANGGNDTVRTNRASYTLANNVENLTYIGDATFSGTGNAANNSITGGIGNDTLDGRAGNDIMTGGLGNDRYVVDSTGDVVVEQSSEGNDMVTASMSYVLGANVENLTLSGNAALNGTGNAVANQITGNSGANILRGAGGADTLNGAGGTDTAAFDQAASSYALDHSGSAVIVSDLVNGEGTDTLTAIENLNFAGANYAILSGTAAINTINGGAGSQAIFALGGNDIINGGAGNDIIVAGIGNDAITLASDTGGRDFIDGGAGEDTFTLATATGAEAFVIYTRTAALQALSGLTLNLNTEIVVTRNGVVIAELDNIEEIVVSSLRVTSPTGANGGTVAGDTIQVVGDFNQTSLNFNTITIDGTQANDVVDISALESAHRIVFTSNGGQDTVVGALRPQDIVNMGTGPVDHAAPVPVDATAPAAVTTPSAALPTDDVVRGTVQRTVDDNPHADDSLHADDKGGLRPQGVTRSDDVPGVDDHSPSHSKNDDDASKARSSDDHGSRHGQKTNNDHSIDPLPGNTASDRYYGTDGADMFKFRGGDTIHDFDDSDDIIDLRGLGVSRDNFKQMVSVSQDSAGLSLKIGDAVMRVLGEDHLSLSDFMFDAGGPAVDQPKRTSDLPTDIRLWDDNPKRHGIEDNLKVEDFMVPRWTVDADLVI